MKILPLRLVCLFSVAVFFACKQTPLKKAKIDFTNDYIRAVSLMEKNPDSAYYYFNKIAEGSNDSLMIGIVYTLMGGIQIKAGDDFGAQETLLKGLSFFKLQDTTNFYSIALCYNELGNSSINLRNYDFAIDYYDRVLEMAADSLSRGIALNGKALAYQRKKDYRAAIDIFNASLARSVKNRREYARALSNLARTKWLQNPQVVVLPDLMKARQIRESENDVSGLHTSYSHLSDYYVSINPDSALWYAQKMHEMAIKTNNPLDELEALQKLMLLSNSKSQFARFNSLNDSLQTARNASKNQFALIRYETEKTKLEKLQLLRENTEKELQIIKQRVLFYTTLGIALIAGLFSLTWTRKRKQRMDWEKQQALKEQQLKTSQKVHDVVANGLYRLMSELEHEKNVDKEELIDRVNDLYEKSRDISYEGAEIQHQAYDQKIETLLSSYSSEATRVLFVGNSTTLWEGIPVNVKNELDYILQELMINMKKHSEAKNVVLKFERGEGELRIQYTDDGVGLPADFRYGNGLKSTGNRIYNLGGAIIFDIAKAKGTKINISFPIGANK